MNFFRQLNYYVSQNVRKIVYESKNVFKEFEIFLWKRDTFDQTQQSNLKILSYRNKVIYILVTWFG